MTGTERKRAWRLRQVEAQKREDKANGRGTPAYLLQPQSDTLKAIRAEVRLKHSLAADNELAVLLPRVRQHCKDLLHRAHRPTLEAVKKLLAGGKLPRC